MDLEWFGEKHISEVFKKQQRERDKKMMAKGVELTLKAISLLKSGNSIDDVSNGTGLSKEKLEHRVVEFKEVCKWNTFQVAIILFHL